MDTLKSLRVRTGLTQLDVAKKLKYLSGQFISNWERGISMPPYSSVKTLAKLYGVDPVKVFHIVWETNKEAALEKALDEAGLEL